MIEWSDGTENSTRLTNVHSTGRGPFLMEKLRFEYQRFLRDGTFFDVPKYLSQSNDNADNVPADC